MSRLSGVLFLVLASSLLAGNARSEDKGPSREKEALRRVQQQVQQLRQEKMIMEEKVAGFDQEKILLTQERDKLVNGALARTKSEILKREQLQLALEAMTQEKQMQKREYEERLAELLAKQSNTERDLTQTRMQKSQAESTTMKREQQVAICEEKNTKLYQHGRDLIEQCRDRSATDAVLRLEPFTGIKRVAIENVLEEYRDKMDTQKLISADRRQ